MIMCVASATNPSMLGGDWIREGEGEGEIPNGEAEERER